jgi:hypothetical protein
MYSLNRIIRTISFVGACALAITAAQAVDPPPDGGYPNNITAEGTNALFSDTAGFNNTATGFQGLLSNTIGSFNTAIGYEALLSNTTASDNTAIGANTLTNNTTGSANTALGLNAGANLTTGSNNINIGNAGIDGESNKIRIGTKPAQKATFIAGISGVIVANGIGVIINPQGQLGTVVSSARFKDAIKPMEKASEAILALQPVTFHYKKELDPDGVPQFGLVAEQVEKVNPYLVARDEQGKPYTVRYEAVNAMLLNEFLKEHRKVEEQAEINQRQEATIARLETALKNQAAQIQKVSDQLKTEAVAPRVVAND